MEVGVRDLRRRFSDYLTRVERGEQVVVLRRGKPIARIMPPESEPAKRLPSMAALRESMEVKGTPLSQLVIRERREERY